MPPDPPVDPDELEPFAVSRRAWFHRVAGVGASLSLAAAGSYGRLVPFLDPQHDVLPGVSTWYATSCRECPAGCGQIVRTREARALKAEGNPDHPTNAGRLCARGQAGVQGLYDPDRVGSPLQRPRPSAATLDQPDEPKPTQARPASWDQALAAIGRQLARLRGTGRVAIISDLQTGSLARLMREWLGLFDSQRYLSYEPLSYESIREANRLLFGAAAIPVPDLARADFLLSLGADFLETWVSPVQFTRQWADGRVPRGGAIRRFVYAGPRISMTAANADERILVRPGDERFLALAMLRVIHDEGLSRSQPVLPAGTLAPYAPETVAEPIGVPADTIRRLARAFARARAPLALAGDPLLAGRPQTEAVLAANLINLSVRSPALDLSVVHALGQTATRADIAAFVDDLGAGAVDALIVVGANPAFSLPLDLDLADALGPVRLVVSLTPYPDETAELADWVLPTHTPLESWGDYQPQTGVLNLMQPVMGPVRDSRMAADVLIALAQAAGCDPQREFGASDARGLVAAEVAAGLGSASPDGGWDSALERGGLWSLPAPSEPSPVASARNLAFGRPSRSEAIRLHIYPQIALFDGRGGNKRWLQELPDPITRVAWSSWAEFSPEGAASLGIEPGDAVAVQQGGARVPAPAVICPGLAPRTVAMPLGRGHTHYGRYAGTSVGNPFELCPPGSPEGDLEVQIEPLAREMPAPSPGGSPLQHRRNVARDIRVSQLSHEEREALDLPLPRGYTRGRDIYPPHQHAEYRWAMAVDLSRCTGCGACVVACYAENNVGVVGPKVFAEHRDMAWIRIDRYYEWGDRGTPIAFIPMLCQHCDAAPCEPVCPVYAAAHNVNGLNMQVYNRCVGTRYCENNCPYKVRRFNWFDWEWPEPLNWQANPEVTVRCRGVMEKCTFCIQRIREAAVHAKIEKRKIRDGEVVPACAQTCPAEALVFGDLKDPNSRISQIVAGDSRVYQVFAELNTKPAVFYRKRVIDDGVLA